MSETIETQKTEVDQQRLVLPRSHGQKHKTLGRHLDALDSAAQTAIYNGYVRRNVKKLDADLVKAIAYAEEARKLLRKNSGFTCD
jgi:hypothetical protein